MTIDSLKLASEVKEVRKKEQKPAFGQSFEKQSIRNNPVVCDAGKNIEAKDSVSFGSDTKTKEKQGGGFFKAICSMIIPGSGQLIDGRTSVGLGFLGTWAALTGAKLFVFREEKKNISETFKKALKGSITPEEAENTIKAIEKNMPKSKKYAKFGFIGSFITLALLAATNAYKGEKK